MTQYDLFGGGGGAVATPTVALTRPQVEARDTYLRRLATGQAWLTETYDAFGDVPARELVPEYDRWVEAMEGWLAMEQLVRQVLGVVGHVGAGDVCGPRVVVRCEACFAVQGVLVDGQPVAQEPPPWGDEERF